MIEQDLDWFKKTIAPSLVNYEIKYKYWETGDFGALNQIEFNSSKYGGNIDFWGLNWLGIFLWDYKEEKELINILLDPSEELEKEKALNDLVNILKL